MKAVAPILPLLVLVVGTVGSDLSPVTRIVRLLEGLAHQLEVEMKTEADLLDKFVCWSNSVVESKTASNAKAQNRKDSLAAYVSDLDAGRIELTSERVDLEKEIAEYATDIGTAEGLRAQENEDYLAASGEMAKAITALEQAIQVLNAVQDQGTSLITLRGKVNQGFRERAAGAEALAHAVEFGQRFLSHADARFLQRLLTGDVPNNDVNWRNLPRKAEFKMSYKARSANILAVLTRLLDTFKVKKNTADAKEEEASAAHQALMTSKKGLKSSAESALQKMELEGAARQLSKSDANAEISALTTQMSNDERFIGEAKQALVDKQQSWQDRKTLRLAELEAINKAVAILRDDDARDLFKRSFHSQGYAFLQVRARARNAAASASTRCHSAAQVISVAADATKDARLVALAARLLQEPVGRFDTVIQAIDTMISTLEAEDGTDLTSKEQCEKDRSDDARSAAVASRDIDEFSDTIASLNAEIAQLDKQIEEREAEIDHVNQTMQEAASVRTAEHTEWLATDKDDEEAAATIQSAKKVLEDFYGQHAAFAQGLTQQPIETKAGEAPPPPPPTWDAPYTVKHAENNGIVAILQMVQDDILKDRRNAQMAEDKSKTKYGAFVSESNAQIDTLNDSITALTTTKGQKQEDVNTAKADRLSKKGELDVVLKKLQDAAPGCDFLTVNFVVRTKNRHIEVQALKTAKSILEGAFSL